MAQDEKVYLVGRLVGSGCLTWRGYCRVQTEGMSGTGHLFLFFEAVEACSSCSHLSQTAAYRQISTLHISKKKTWTYYTSGGERNGILGSGGWSWVGWSVIIILVGNR